MSGAGGAGGENRSGGARGTGREGRDGGDLLELRFHFGERDRDRDDDRPLEAAVMDACARRGVEAAVTLRGVEGFGAKHQQRTDRLLSLSEDAPLLVVAVGETARVEALADEVRGTVRDGLLGLTSIGTAASSAAMAAMPMGDGAEGSASRSDSGDRVKATVWGPRGGPGSPHLAAVAALHARGAEAATVLLGVDGVLDGERRRARFIAGNRSVPAITVAIGERATVEAALTDLDHAPPLVTFEPVGGNRRIATVSHHTRVTLVTSEIATSGAHPRYLALIHALREEGAAGAMALRGVWGFGGRRNPHGDRVLALRRDVPLLVETVDVPERAARWLEIAELLAGEDDVVHAQRDQRTFTLG